LNTDARHKPLFVMSNHPTRIDWLVLWSWWARFATIGKQKISLKYGLKLLPGAGWGMQFAGFLFLRRHWVADQMHMTAAFDYYKRNNFTAQWLFFPEGTNLTPETAAIDLKYVEKTREKLGLTSYKHVLHPRTTGFVHAINELRATTDVLYDVTMGYDDGYDWTEFDLAHGRLPQTVHFIFKRYDLKTLPTDEEKLGEWCQLRFAEKEARLARFRADGGVFAPASGCAEVLPQIVPIFRYGMVVALWTLYSLACGWLIWTCWIARWYFLFGCIFEFAIGLWAGGADTLTFKRSFAAGRADAKVKG